MMFSSIFLLFLVVSCKADSEKAQNILPVKELTIENSEGKTITVQTEIAQTEEQHRKGLMFRKTLQDGYGMIFIYKIDQVMSFWMKNTYVPLSIAFISRDGTIIDIFDMEPESTIPINSTRSVRYALEVPQGYFSRTGIKSGDKVNLESIFTQ